MPLPENWNGIFWSKDDGGDLLFDRTVDEFAVIASSQDRNPAFLFAAAHLDLAVYGDTDRATAFLTAGRLHWPDAPWSKYEEFVNPRLAKIRANLSRTNTKSLVYATISTLFRE